MDKRAAETDAAVKAKMRTGFQFVREKKRCSSRAPLEKPLK
jgi:hypothetical protein